MERDETRDSRHAENSHTYIKSFVDLRVWKETHILTLLIYGLTKKFPKYESFGLTNQIRRAAISVTSNIVEGFGRHSSQEKARFYEIARGSLAELQNQALIARDIHYVTGAEFNKIAEQSVTCNKILNGLIKATKDRASHVSRRTSES